MEDVGRGYGEGFVDLLIARRWVWISGLVGLGAWWELPKTPSSIGLLAAMREMWRLRGLEVTVRNLRVAFNG